MDTATVASVPESPVPTDSPKISPKAILLIVLLAASTALLTWRARIIERGLEDERDLPEMVTQMAPDFTAQTMDGRTVSLADYRGQKNVVLSFWASWCGPCRMEMPGLIEFYKKNHTADSDFELLAISIDEDTKDAADFAAGSQLPFPVIFDPHQRVAESFRVESIPTMFVVDKSGKIIGGNTGFDMAMEYRLRQELGIKENSKGEADDSSSH